MHAERLNLIFSEILADDGKNNHIQKLTDLKTAIENRISNPNDPNTENAVSENLKTLLDSLDASETNNFHPISRKIIDELNLEVLIASNIKERVENSLNNNMIDTDKKNEIDTLISEINEKKTAITEASSGFQKVGIGTDKLENLECELNFSIPRDFVNNDLKSFGTEINKLNVLLQSMSEVLKEEHRGFKIRNISSTDLTVAININVDLAEIILYSLVGIQMTFMQMKDKQDLIDKLTDLPENLTTGLKDWATNQLSEKTDLMVDEIGEKFGEIIDKDKFDQLKGTVRGAILDLVKRLQKGVNIEINVGDAEEEPDDQAEDEEKDPEKVGEMRNRLKEISKKSAELTVLQLQKNPIFNIEHLTPDETDNTEEGVDD